MRLFLKAVISGFGMSVGAALFRRVSERLGFEDSSDGKKKNGRKSEPGVEVPPIEVSRDPDAT
jgi:hypothetical protein